MKRLVVDTDPGVDDTIAFLMAFAHPDVRIEAITTVAGNVGLDKTTANALRILDMVGQDVPVYAGCDRALIFKQPDASDAHGNDGLGGSGWPASSRMPEAEHGAKALIRLANENPGDLTLVAIGPLTNLALATRLDPGLPGKYKELIIMGGAVRGIGNVSTITAEFNIFYDPDAAHVVFSEWPMVTVSDWQATVDNALTADQLDTLRAIDTPKGKFFHAITARGKERMVRLNRPGYFIPDPLAMAAVLEPETVTHSEQRYIQLELAGQLTRGQTVVDWYGRTGKTPNATIITRLDMGRVYEMIRQSLQ